MKTGIELIGKERTRQIEEEGWTAEHDANHINGELAMAAACYAATKKIYVFNDKYVQLIEFEDPFPFESKWDRRFRCEPVKNLRGNRIPDPSRYTKENRIDLLIKAGALIAAEIDRLNRCGIKQPIKEATAVKDQDGNYWECKKCGYFGPHKVCPTCGIKPQPDKKT